MVYAFAADFQVLPPALLFAITLIPYLTFFVILVRVKEVDIWWSVLWLRNVCYSEEGKDKFLPDKRCFCLTAG